MSTTYGKLITVNSSRKRSVIVLLNVCAITTTFQKLVSSYLMYTYISFLCAKYVLLVPPDVIETSDSGIYSTVGKVKKKS
jgi:hypothetical protein